MSTFEPKRCTKCKWVYISRTEWELLKYAGIQDSGEPDFDLELRTCPCGSTLAIKVDKQTREEMRHVA